MWEEKKTEVNLGILSKGHKQIQRTEVIHPFCCTKASLSQFRKFDQLFDRHI